MATRDVTITNPNVHLQDDTNWLLAKWEGLQTSDDGAPVELPAYSDRCVQVSGTFGVGGTILLEGSNDGATYATLRDVLGSAISLNAAGLRTPVDLPRYVRPRVSAGDGDTDLAVTLLLRRQV